MQMSPEGRPVNLGELVADPSDKAKIKVSSDLQAFALIITAEPYFSVTQPSDVVVMENVLLPETVGRVQEVEAKYELLPRGHFTYDTGAPPTLPSGAKLSMGEYEALVATYQAQNAIQIARAAGARPVAVISDDTRVDYCKKLGAVGVVNRKGFKHWGMLPHWKDDAGYATWLKGARAFGSAFWEALGERANPTLVFEHPGEDTVPTSTFMCETGGMVVICAGTTIDRFAYPGQPAEARLLW